MAIDPSMTWDGDAKQWDTDPSIWDSSQFDLTFSQAFTLSYGNDLLKYVPRTIYEGISVGFGDQVLRTFKGQFFAQISLGFTPLNIRIYMIEMPSGFLVGYGADRAYTAACSLDSGILLGDQVWVYNQVYGDVGFGVDLGCVLEGNANFPLTLLAGISLRFSSGGNGTWNCATEDTVLLGGGADFINQKSLLTTFNGVWLDAPMKVRNPWDSDFDQGVVEIWTEVQNGSLGEVWSPVPNGGDEEDWQLAPDPPPEVPVRS